MRNVFTKTVLAVVVASAAFAAQANNRDVNSFITKVENAAAQPTRSDLYNEAVNAYDNLNARDRMVVAGYQDKMPHPGLVADVIGSGEARGHQANVPAGWKPELTRAQIAEAHRPAHGTPGQSARKANVSGPASQPVATGVPVNTVNPISTAIISVTKATDAKLALKADKTELAAETQARKDEDANIHHLLNAEGVSRVKTDNHLQDEIDGHETRITNLENAPKPADGKDGAKGDKGDQGIAGLNGKDGHDGKDGLNGKDADMTKVNKNTSDIQNLTVDVTANTARAADLDNRIAQQKAEQAKTNQTVAQHSKQLADHESRIQDLERNTSNGFAQLKSQVEKNKRNADAGIAGVAAMANIPQVTESQNFAVGAGVGSRQGESAVAVGVSFRASQNVVVKATVAGDTQQSWTVGAGVSYGW